MSVLLSDRLNKSIDEFRETMLLLCCDNTDRVKYEIGLLKGAICTEVAIKNQEYKTHINELKIALNELKNVRVDMVDYANKLLKDIGGTK